MKTKLLAGLCLHKKPLALLVCFLLLQAVPGTSFANTEVQQTVPIEKNRVISKRLFKKNNSVKVYHGFFRKKVHVIAKGDVKRIVDFYMFTIDGKLVKNIRLLGGDHKKISGLKKGDYTYEVYEGDERNDAGTITIK